MIKTLLALAAADLIEGERTTLAVPLGFETAWVNASHCRTHVTVDCGDFRFEIVRVRDDGHRVWISVLDVSRPVDQDRPISTFFCIAETALDTEVVEAAEEAFKIFKKRSSPA